MFGLFGKKKETQTPEERLAELRRKGDFPGLARAYYELGAAAMDQGDLNRAQLWLHRADTVYSADDRTCRKVGEKLMDDCSERVGALEDEAALFYNAVPARIEEEAEALNDPQLRVWGMLSMARLAVLGKRLGALPGCAVLGELGWAAELMLRSTREAPSQEEYQRLMGVCNDLYALGDSPAFYAGGEIQVPGGAPFQVFDLNGMMGVHLELNGFIDSHLRLLAALSQGKQDLPAPECGAVTCALLPDYHVRTGAGGIRLEEVPRIRAELRRIREDLAFVRDRLNWEEADRRMSEYLRLDILEN